jgi:hypothetical protein
MRAMHNEKFSKKPAKAVRGACAMVINFPRKEQAEALEKDMKTSIPSPAISKKFDLRRKGNALSINMHDVQDTEFCGAFLLAISASVKELVIAANEEAKLSFEFKGADEAGTAVCVASHGLWPAEFSFSSEAEKDKFDAAREDIDTQITAITDAAMPLLKKALAEEGLLEDEGKGGKGKK